MISFDYLTHTKNFLTKDAVAKYYKKTDNFLAKLESGNESMTDWYEISTTVTNDEVKQVITKANEIRKNANVLVVVGIGGSFAGSNAAIQALSPYFKSASNTEVIYAGTDLSSEYLIELAQHLKDKEFYINAISKSGSTLEVKLAFDYLYNLTKEKYGKDYKKRIIITTDKENGYFRKLANQEKLTSFVIPSEIGGRFSCLTTAGLLPMAVGGVDIEKLLEGARRAKNYIPKAIDYAIARHIMLKKNRVVEGLTFYEKKLNGFALWAQQLLGESLGKNQSGVLPIINRNTTNLHSIGQFIQEGSKILFETVIKINNSQDLIINNTSLNSINDIAISAVATAHANGNVPTLIISIDKLNEENLGELIYFYYVTASICGYLQNVNPFDQPGVEEYKRLIKEKMAEEVK